MPCSSGTPCVRLPRTRPEQRAPRGGRLAPQPTPSTSRLRRSSAAPSASPTAAPFAGPAAAAALLRRDAPIVVLVDRGTASSAELFAAALRDNGRGVLIGEHTYGKGLIQRVFPMPNGGALKLTIGEYLTPHHASIEHGVGLMPDMQCRATPTPGTEDACITRASRQAAGMARRQAGRLPRANAPVMSLSRGGWRAALRRVPLV